MVEPVAAGSSLSAPAAHEHLPRRIVVFSPGVFHPYGHCHDYSAGLGHALAARGHQVVALGWDGPLRLAPPIEEVRVPLRPGAASLRSAFRRFGFIGDIAWGVARIQSETALVRQLSATAGRWPGAAVILESFDYAALCVHISSLARDRPVVCVLHETNFNLRHATAAAGAYKFLSRPLIRWIVRHATATLVHGDAMRENLLANVDPAGRLASRIHTLPYGAPHPESVARRPRVAAREALGLPRTGRVLLAFGTLRRDKRFDVVLQALANTPGWVLVVAGPEGDLTFSQFETLVRAHGLEGRVYVHPGFVLPDRHADYFGAADAVVGIYDRGVRHESGTVQLARCYLRPVIVGGPPDLQRYVETYGVGWQVDPSDPAALSSLLNHLADAGVLEGASLRERIARCAVERSWPAVAARLESHLGWGNREG